MLGSPKVADVVDAGEAFLAMLTEEQRAVARIELKPQLAANWSNFPEGMVRRNGIFFRELKPGTIDALFDAGKARVEEGWIWRV